jgi:hypothetical protein
MLWEGFKPTIPMFEVAKTFHALDGSSASCTVKKLGFFILVFGGINCVEIGHGWKLCRSVKSTILWEVMRVVWQVYRCCGEWYCLRLQGRSTSQVLIQKHSAVHSHPYSNLKSDSGYVFRKYPSRISDQLLANRNKVFLGIFGKEIFNVAVTQ